MTAARPALAFAQRHHATPPQIVGAHNLHVVKSEPCASMVFVTRVAFANDDSRVLAVGGDANAFVMDLEQRGGGGG